MTSIKCHLTAVMNSSCALKLIIAYDGAPYFGMQKSREGPTIEGELTSVLEQILGHEVKLQAASRTDRGVHASGQVIQFHTRSNIDPYKLKGALNGLLSPAIRILDCTIVDPIFHPSCDAKGKEYRYFVASGPIQLPLHRKTSWHVVGTLDVEKMRLEATELVGKRDFASFANTCVDPKEETVCHLEKIEILEGDLIEFRFTGDRFLYKMVRNLVGHLIYVGLGKEGRMTAPAWGLFLTQVHY